MHSHLLIQTPQRSKGVRELVAELENMKPLTKAAAEAAAEEFSAAITSLLEHMGGRFMLDHLTAKAAGGSGDRRDSLKKPDPNNHGPKDSRGNAWGPSEMIKWEILKQNLTGGIPRNKDVDQFNAKDNASKYPFGGYYMPPASTWDAFADWMDQIAHGDGYQDPDDPKSVRPVGGHGSARWFKQFDAMQEPTPPSGGWLGDLLDAVRRLTAQAEKDNAAPQTQFQPSPPPLTLSERVKAYAEAQAANPEPDMHRHGYEEAEAEYTKKQASIHDERMRALFGHSNWRNQFGSGTSGDGKGISQVDLAGIVQRTASSKTKDLVAGQGRIEKLMVELLQEIRNDNHNRIQEALANMHRLAALGY